jgi:hypothetical protein
MGKLANLRLGLAFISGLFALPLKLAVSGQIVVASLSTTVISVVIWKTSHYFSAKNLMISYQIQQGVLAQPLLLPPTKHTPFRGIKND